MTVKQLREAIEGLPDDYRIILDNGKSEADDHNEILSVFTYFRHGRDEQPRVVVLQTRDDLDVKEEINSFMFHYLCNVDLRPSEAISLLEEFGFKSDDFKKSDYYDFYRLYGRCNKVRKEKGEIMTRDEGIEICIEALKEHEDGSNEYFSLLEDLQNLKEKENG